MNQEKERTFCILREDTTYYDSTNAYEYFVEVLEEEEEGFTRDKILDGNEFSTPFQDIWLNPEQTHQVCFVHDPLFKINYVRIHRQSDLEQKSIFRLSEWFYCYWDGELCEVANKALEENDEDKVSCAIFNFAVGFHADDRTPAIMMFEQYLKSPSVKVRLATIRAVGFQLWNECAPILENLISSDPNPAVREYATQTLKQIQRSDFDPDDLYENPSNYPHSFERITEKGLMILPQIKDDLQAWMKENGYQVVDALVLYQYLVEVYGEFKPTDEPIEEDETGESLIENKDNSEPTTEKIEPEQPEINQSQQLQQELAQDKKQLKRLRSQLKTIEERIREARRTNIFGRPESGANERERDRFVREIENTRVRIKQNESLLEAEEEQIEEN